MLDIHSISQSIMTTIRTRAQRFDEYAKSSDQIETQRFHMALRWRDTDHSEYRKYKIQSMLHLRNR